MKIISILYENKEVGKLSFNESNQRSIFRYNQDWLQNDIELFPNRLNKTVNQKFSFDPKGTPFFTFPSFEDSTGGFFYDTILKQKYNIEDIKSIPIPERLCMVGKNGMGALKYLPSYPLEKLQKNIKIDDIISSIDSLDSLDAKSIQLLENASLGVGGVKPKILVDIDDKKNIIISNKNNDKKYILKLEQNQDNHKLEFIYNEISRNSGIITNESNLLIHKDEMYFYAKRFDRKENGERIHMQSYSALNFHSHRYSYDCEKVFKTINNIGASQKDKEQFYRLASFNVIGNNKDDHAKNISFLMDNKGQWSLSPAYDLMYQKEITTNKYQMQREKLGAINGKTSDINRKDLMLLSRGEVDHPKEILEQTLDSFDIFQKRAKDLDISPKKIKEVKLQIDKNRLNLSKGKSIFIDKSNLEI